MADSQSWWDEHFGGSRDEHFGGSRDVVTKEAVDLDDEDAVQPLEDPKLISHMDYRRAQNKLAESTMRAQVSHLEIRKDLTMAMDDFAKALLEMEEPLGNGGTAADEVYVIGSQLQRWGEGQIAEPNFSEGLRLVGTSEKALLAKTTQNTCKVLQKDADKLKMAISQISGLKVRFAKFRLATIKTWDNYQRLVESQEATLNANRELLKSAAEVYAYNEKRATKKFAEIRQNMGVIRTAASAQTAAAAQSLAAVPEQQLLVALGQLAKAVPEPDMPQPGRGEAATQEEAGRMIPEEVEVNGEVAFE